MEENLYEIINELIKQNFGNKLFKHRVIGHEYEIDGIEPNLCDTMKWYIKAFDRTDKKYVSFGLEHLRLLEEVENGN